MFDDDYYQDRLLWAAIAAVCVLAVMGNLIVWLLVRGSDGDSSDTPAGTDLGRVSAENPSSDRPDSGVPQSDSAVQLAMADCRERWQQQRLPLRAAQSSLRQWRVHVRAMNQLVAGDISLSQATAFWNQTRKGAMHRIMEFEHAESRYSDAAPGCDTNRVQATADNAFPASSRDCMRAAVAGDRVLAAAGNAITTWQHHVHHMEMLRTGQLSAAQASRMWQMSWQAGKRELVEYGRASTRALYLRCA